MTTTPTTAEQVLRGYLDALLTGDLDVIAECFAPSATWTVHGTLPLSGTRTGRDEIIGFLTSAGALYEPGTQSFTFGDITAAGDRAVLEWTVRGVASATGLAYDNDYCGVFVIADGVIVEVREYLDTQHVAEVLFGSSSGVGPS